MNDKWISPLLAIFGAVALLSLCGVLTFAALIAFGIVKVAGG